MTHYHIPHRVNANFQVSVSVICKPLYACFFTKCKVSSYKSCSSHSTHIATLQECVMYYFGAQSCVSVTRINVLKSVRVVSVYFSNLLMLIREGVNVLGNLFNVLVFVFFSCWMLSRQCVYGKRFGSGPCNVVISGLAGVYTVGGSTGEVILPNSHTCSTHPPLCV